MTFNFSPKTLSLALHHDFLREPRRLGIMSGEGKETQKTALGSQCGCFPHREETSMLVSEGFKFLPTQVVTDPSRLKPLPVGVD